MLNFTKDKNVPEKTFDASKCPKKVEFIFNVAVHGKLLYISCLIFIRVIGALDKD